MFTSIQLSRMTAGNTCDFGLCEADTVGGKHIPAAIALNVTPQNGYTNHYICRPHLIGLIETIFDDPEYGPIAMEIFKGKSLDKAWTYAQYESEQKAIEEARRAEEEATALPVEKQTYPCRKCGKLIKNPAARDIHEIHCSKGVPTDEEVGKDYLPDLKTLSGGEIEAEVKVETGDLETPADFKGTFGDKETEGPGY